MLIYNTTCGIEILCTKISRYGPKSINNTATKPPIYIGVQVKKGGLGVQLLSLVGEQDQCLIALAHGPMTLLASALLLALNHKE